MKVFTLVRVQPSEPNEHTQRPPMLVTWDNTTARVAVHVGVYESSYDGPVSFEGYAVYAADLIGLEETEQTNVEYRGRFISRRHEALLEGRC